MRFGVVTFAITFSISRIYCFCLDHAWMIKASEWWVLTPLVMSLLGLNSFLLPKLYDNAAYLALGEALANGQGYVLEGVPMTLWPPLFAVQLALLSMLGGHTVLAAKGLVLACAAGGVLASGKLLSREGYAFPLLAVIVAWLLPEVLHFGVAVMTEIPYTAVSLGFLLILGKQRSARRGLGFAVLAGLVFAAAALTRWLGVLLGAALVVQMAMQWAGRREEAWWRRVLPELLTTLTAATLGPVAK
jgi:hypothetical protein